MSGRTEVWGLDIGDGCWALAHLIVEQGRLSLDGKTRCYEDAEPIPGVIQVAVLDIPIGLLADETAAVTPKGRSGDRPVDKGARKWCRSPSSVFPPPTLTQLESGFAEHQRAREGQTKTQRRRVPGNVKPGGLSTQCFELVPAIQSARLMKERDEQRVFESHPEVVFTALAGGMLTCPKTTLAGALLRVAILERHLKIEGLLSKVLKLERSTRLAADNWLDAIAMGAVALDWARATAARQVLQGADARPQPWAAQLSSRIMALPATELDAPPDDLAQEAIDNLLLPFARMASSRPPREP